MKKEVTAKWMASKLIALLMNNPYIDVKGMRYELDKWGVDPLYMQFYKAKIGNGGDTWHSCRYVPKTTQVFIDGEDYKEADIEVDEQNFGRPPIAPTFEKFFLGLRRIVHNSLDLVVVTSNNDMGESFYLQQHSRNYSLN